jgi:hypothetical protein
MAGAFEAEDGKRGKGKGGRRKGNIVHKVCT